MAEKPDITIIGPGVVGRTLGKVAYRVGYRIAAVAGGSHPEQTAAFAASVGDAQVLPLAQAAAAGQLVLLTVKDDAVEPVCEQLVSAGGLRHRPVVAHCSGALGSNVLHAAGALGCAVGSIHPLQTFPSVEASLGRIPGTYFFIEGDSPAAEPLENLARTMGGHSVRIDSAAKSLYHAAAVMSANYLTTLLDAALDLYQAVGMARDEARKAMSPLVRATIENVLQKGTRQALTGPIARGDARVVAHHIEALRRDHPSIESLYRIIGQRTVDLAARCGKLDEATLRKLRSVLESE